jgi:hypothetical protein
MADVSITTALEGLGQVEAGLRQLENNIKGVRSELGGTSKETSATNKEMSSLKDGLRGVNAELSRFAPASVSRVAAALGSVAGATGLVLGGITLVAGAFVGFTKQLGQTVEQLDNTAARMLLTVEQVQRLQFVADQAGVGLGAMESAVFILNQRIDQAVEGDERLRESFDQLGIQILDTNGDVKSGYDVLLQLDQALAGMEGPEKARVAMQIMGRGARQVLQVLKGDLKEVADTAPVMSDALIEAGRKSDKAFDGMSRNAQEMKLFFLGELVPAFNAVSDEIEGMNKALQEDRGFSHFLTRLFQLTSPLYGVLRALGLIKDTVQTPTSAAMFDNANKGAVDLQKNTKLAQSELDVLFKSMNLGTSKLPTSVKNPWSAVADDVKKATSRGSGVDPLAPLKAMREELQRSIDTFGLGANAAKAWNLEHGELSRISGKAAAALREQNAALLGTLTAKEQSKRLAEDQAEADRHLMETQNEIKQQANDYKDSLREQASAMEDAADPAREYMRELERISMVNQEVKLSSGAMSAAVKAAADKFQSTTSEMTEFAKQAARNMQDAMSEFFFDAFQGKLGNLADSFKRTIDKMVADLIASKLNNFLFGSFGTTGQLGGALGGGGFGSVLSGLFGATSGAFGPSAASAVAMGSLGTNALSQQSLMLAAQQFQSGGSFNVGGVGGPDSQLVAFKATPGERVQIGQPKDMGAGVVFHFNVTTPDANSFRRSQGQLIAEAATALQRARRNM